MRSLRPRAFDECLDGADLRATQPPPKMFCRTFLSAFKAIIRALRARRSFATWLYRIAHNAALMRLRKRQVQTVSLDEPMEDEEGLPEPRKFRSWSENPERAAEWQCAVPWTRQLPYFRKR